MHASARDPWHRSPRLCHPNRSAAPLITLSSRPERKRGPRRAPFLRSVGCWSGVEGPAVRSRRKGNSRYPRCHPDGTRSPNTLSSQPKCRPLITLSSRPEQKRGPRRAPFLRSVGCWSGVEGPAVRSQWNEQRPHSSRHLDQRLLLHSLNHRHAAVPSHHR